MASQDTPNTQAQQSSSTATDPVCGMEVDPATAAGTSTYQGTTYYFCSVGCKRRFDNDPQSFADAPARP